MKVNCEKSGDKLRFEIEGISTGCLDADDSFITRIDESNLNPDFMEEHLKKEIEIKNRLDDGIDFFKKGKYSKAIGCFDDVIYYDPLYGEALMYKSKSLQGQGHFVKALRHYKKAVKADESLADIEYQKTLQRQANDERGEFPKIKSNIYAGDEYFAQQDYENALKSYDRALMNPSKFKERILFKLLNKKATTLYKLKRFDEALECFSKSLDVNRSDYAFYGEGICRFELGMEIGDEFKRPLEITKRQALNQILVLNELEFFDESLVICDEILKNHFALDDLYFRILDCRAHACSNCRNI